MGNNDVLITLCLGDTFEDNKNDIIIKRNFLKRNKKIAKINEKNYTNEKEYETELNKLVFNSNQQKPTFRQLISRSIRKGANQMDSVVEYSNAFTSNNDYESIYFFLFDLVKASDLSMQKKIEEATKKYSENVIKNTFQQKSSKAISQSLALVNHQISELQEKKNTFNINLKFTEEAIILKEIRAKIIK